MGYLEESLGADEVLVMRAQFPWLYYAGAALVLVVALCAAGLLLGSTGLVWLPAMVAACGGIIALAILIPLWATEIGVINQRLIMKRGVLGRRTDEIQLWAIEEANLNQSALGRVFGYGRINVQGTGDDAVSIPAIADPLGFRKAIQDAIGRAGRPAGSATGAARPRAI